MTTNDAQRILDTDLAERLGMKTPRNIRDDLIKSNMEELLGFGDLGETTPNAGKVGRPSKVCYLNAEQALLLCPLS
ncbi:MULTISPECIES: hypothetical protein [Ensifer]|uniref:hypothetical protein n=1 Tax=Ensifer TaxID=106591 RepID=UPI0007135ADF|nr:MULTISPECIES: hypothetical protein [Ensifer]KQX21782.1 hypothetical protein ASD01_29135 [Ensifer sp. Root423]QHG70106.1 hypothetical protein DQW09_09680 [Ensifer adhaerens]